MRSLELAKIKFDSNGLVPVVVQDANSLRVLMLAYASKKSLEMTIETGQMVYFSRSRNEIWHKGATSGNFQDVVELSLDCDSDTVLAKVHTHGPACHNGTATCFEEA